MSTTADNRTAVLNAVALVAGGNTGCIPAARALRAINTLAHTGTVDALYIARASMPSLVRDLVDWHGEKRATKPVIKSISAAIVETDEHGRSRYPHAVELASYLAVCAPLLEPDHLADLATSCRNTANAYAPISTITRTATQLANILEGFSTKQKRHLLVSLWESAHDGRWWDATVSSAAPRKMRATSDDRATSAEACKAYTDRHDPVGLIGQMCSGLAEYSPESASVLDRATIDRDTAKTLAATLRDGRRDPDVNVLASWIGALKPLERPDNPIPAMLDILVHAVVLDDDETYNDVFATDEIDQWSDLYPEASRARYPYSKEFVTATNGVALPGVPGASVSICRSAQELVANRDYMGNCTYGWNHRCIEGTAVIGIVSLRGERYNFELTAHGPRWTLGQVNCRFNGAHGHTTPATIPAALAAWTPTLPR